MRRASIWVVADLEDICPLACLPEDEAKLAPGLLAGPLAVGLAQLAALCPDQRLPVLVGHLVPGLAAQGTPDCHTNTLARLLGAPQGSTLVPVLLSPQVDVVEQAFQGLLGAEIWAELHAQGRVGHVGRVAVVIVIVVVILLLALAVRVATVVHGKLQTLLGERDLVLEGLLALDHDVVELLLAVHHELGELEQLVDGVLETLEAAPVDDKLSLRVRRAPRAMVGCGRSRVREDAGVGALLQVVGGNGYLLRMHGSGEIRIHV